LRLLVLQLLTEQHSTKETGAEIHEIRNRDLDTFPITTIQRSGPEENPTE